MNSARYQWDNTQGRAAERLQDGRVLMVANDVDDLQGVLGTSELFNPATGTWTATGSLITARSVVTTLFNNGRVLVEGGVDSFGDLFGSAWLYDPGTGRWSSTGGLNTARDGHSATMLSDGRVLVAGTLLNNGKVLMVGGQNLAGNPSGNRRAVQSGNRHMVSHRQLGDGSCVPLCRAPWQWQGAGGGWRDQQHPDPYRLRQR